MLTETLGPPEERETIPRQSESTTREHRRVHEGDSRWMLAKRVVASRSLGRSRLLSEFLLHVVERHIEGRADDITEQQIGIVVFGRAEGYDSNEDNIVRSYARSLRKRMQEYFAAEGRDESMLLEIRAEAMRRSSLRECKQTPQGKRSLQRRRLRLLPAHLQSRTRLPCSQ